MSEIDPELPEVITTTKQDAALHQILAAIDAMRVGRYECAITLAGAAEGMLPEPIRPSFRSHLMGVPVPEELHRYFNGRLDEKGRNTFWNKQRDWLKHKTPQQALEIKIWREQVEMMILRAILKLPSEAIQLDKMPAHIRSDIRRFLESVLTLDLDDILNL